MECPACRREVLPSAAYSKPDEHNALCVRRKARLLPKTTPMIFSRRLLLLGLAALSLAGCADKPTVSHIQDPEVDFHAYHTFAFFPTPPWEITSLAQRRLVAAARSQLERRGCALDTVHPDLLVNIGAGVEERQGLRRAPGTPPGPDGVETEDYRLGRLAIDLLDANRGQVVWQGTAEGRVSDTMLRDEGTAVEKAVEDVFEGFPIPATAPAATTQAPKAG